MDNIEIVKTNSDDILSDIDNHNQKISESKEKELKHIEQELTKDIKKIYGGIIVNPKVKNVKEPIRKMFFFGKLK